jgi:hypothetical protein
MGKNIITRAKTSSSNPCDDAESTSVEQEQRETIKFVMLMWQRLQYSKFSGWQSYTNTAAVDCGSENKLNDRTFLLCKKFGNIQTHRKESLNEIQRLCYLY